MSRPVRTRFAPSPTGALHVGNLRVAVFNFLFARRHAGRFILRIEDTDMERNVEGGLAGILEDLAWAGLPWDEGPDRGGSHGPYLQSARGPLHDRRVRELLERGRAYACFCSEEQLATLRSGGRVDPACPGGCRGIPAAEAGARVANGELAAIRFAVPPGSIVIRDAIRGEVTFPAADVGDFVIRRADGRATYNFAVVADDVDMEISHVIRGAGHLSNTPKQALLFDAFGMPRPVFAHLPTVLGQDGQKLSKRTGAPGVRALREAGFHPHGVVNYLSLLGWSPGDDREVLSPEELTRSMDLTRAGVSDSMFDPEKLRWMSGRHIATMSVSEVAAAVEPFLDRERFPLDPERMLPAVAAVHSRLQLFGEVNTYLSMIFADEAELLAGRELIASEPGALSVLAAAQESLRQLPEWTEDAVAGAIREAGKEAGARGPALFHPVRLALSGARSGPDLGKVLVALGRERSVELLTAAISRLTVAGDPP